MRRTQQDLKRCAGSMPGGGRCYFNRRPGKETCAAHEDPDVWDPAALNRYAEKLGSRRWSIECGAIEPPKRVARSLDSL